MIPTHHCSLCGYRFNENEMAERGCATCPTRSGGCGLVRCPSCGYEWPPESGSVLAGLIGRLFSREDPKESSRGET